MKFIHTSDWHLGRSLYGRKRYREHQQFLDWLVTLIAEEDIEALLVAGDIFDSSTPSNRALQLYYQFLCRVADSGCRHVVITAGNHDSPSLLNAPREVLRFLNVHVIGAMTESLEDEILLLKNQAGEPEMIVSAVPYLRDRDIRRAEAGESIEDKGRKLVSGIQDHYQAVTQAAEKQRQALAESSSPVPLVAMGHLFTAGGKTSDGDGVRDLYVGSLAYIEGAAFPEEIDYLALGHLHLAQKVGGREDRRYCGSPIPMGFGESKRPQNILVVEFDKGQLEVTETPVPRFQELETVSGDLEAIISKIEALKLDERPVWLEVSYDGDAIVADLQGRLAEAVADSQLEILRIKNNRIIEQVLKQSVIEETLDDLKVDDVFQRCLSTNLVPDEQYDELEATFQEIVSLIHEEDHHNE